MAFPEFTTKEIKEVFEILKSRESGLTEKEVKERQRIYGLNEIKEKEISPVEVFLRQLKSPFFYLLLIAGILAFFVGEKINSLLIFIFAILNTILGFSQEFRAQRALSLLKAYFPPDVNVLRGGKERIIDKKFLVPGDVVILESGDIAPADLRIIETKNLLVDESILTGESEPVAKTSEKLEKKTNQVFEAKNILFSGTSLVSGKAKGIVISIGKETEIGKIGKLIAKIERPSLYQKEIVDFSKMIIRFVILTIFLISIINLFLKKQQNQIDFLIFCLALIVGLVPEALPVVVGVSLSNGALRLAKRNVLVKRLEAIEDLGNIEVLCTDKTGTITENKLILTEIISEDKEKCLKFAFLSSSLLEKEIDVVQNPFDLAIFEKLKEKIKDLKKARLIFEIPFSPQRLRNSALVEFGGKRFLILRGAPEKILELSIVKEKEKILNKAKEKGKEGKRVLAIAFKEFSAEKYSERDENNLEFLGILCFFDPLKKDAKATINLAKKLGIKIKILTGDAPEVAGAIGKEVGLIEKENEVILRKDLENLSEKEFDDACEKFSVFARVLPETKLKIIKSLQKKYEVGFVGEGINDAPALKIANVAIAVKGAAEISKESADIILLKDDLKTVIEGIKRGRNIFSNIQKYIKATLASNFGNMYSMAGISLIFPFLPMLPTQVLLLNLLSDLPLVSIATDTLDAEELRKPKAQKFSQIFPYIFFLALVSSLFDFIFFGIFYPQGEKSIQTHWFLLSVLTELMIIFSVRTRKFFMFSKAPSPILISLSILVWLFSFSLPFTSFGKKYFHFITPTLQTILIIISLSLAYLVVNEIVKNLYFRHYLTRRPRD
ncbi:MAG: cation-translocating P-type ATPase [Minisyncoccales bacterium]